MELKSGWKTSEFWVLLTSKLLSLLALLGVIAPTDVQSLNDASAKVFAALGVLLVQAILVYHYISSRVHLKTLAAPQTEQEQERHHPPSDGLGILGMLVACAFFLPAPLCAQQERSSFTPAPSTKTQAKTPTKTCLQIGLINVGGRRKPQDSAPAQPPAPAPAPAPVADPPVLAELKRIGDLQAQQVALLQAQLQRSAPAPSPAPGDKPPTQAQPPHIIIISPGAGTPKIELPGNGTPKYVLPPGGDPKYVLPPGGDPRYVLPPGGDPRYVLPPGGAPKIPLPGGPAPGPALPDLPGGGTPPVGLPSAAAGPPPAGFMRYTRTPTRSRATYALYR